MHAPRTRISLCRWGGRAGRRPASTPSCTGRAGSGCTPKPAGQQGSGRVWERSRPAPTNAAAESFNSTLKRETLKGSNGWSTEHEARLDAFRWLNRYNTRRWHSRLGQQSPIAFENELQPTTTTPARTA
ncbi:integrase core domain-containing protein [Streptomyces chartreusis]